MNNSVYFEKQSKSLRSLASPTKEDHITTHNTHTHRPLGMFSDDALLREDFDPVSFLKHTLHLPNVEAEHAKIQRCTDIIDGDIRAAVSTNYESMLSQVDTTTRVAKETERLKSSVGTLSSALGRLHHTIETPYSTIQSAGTELRNATSALDMLRSVQKLLSAVSKLPDAEASSKTMDLHRTARKIKEIDDLLALENFSGIHIVDKALAEVTALSAMTRSRAQEMLRQGLSSGRQTDISTALHALNTLGVGGRVIGNYLTELKRDTLKTLMQLDAQSMSIELSEQSDIATAKDLVLSHIEKALGEVRSRCSLALLLMRTVQKQHQHGAQGGGLVSSSSSSSTHSFSDETAPAFEDYATSVGSQIYERLGKISKKANLNGVLVTEYPRYSKIIDSFAVSCEPLFAVSAFGSSEQWQQKVVEDVERLFGSHIAEKQRDKLQQIITRLNGIVPRGGSLDSAIADLVVDILKPNVPSQATPIDARPITKVIASDLAFGRSDVRLAPFYINTTTDTLTVLLERLKEGASRVPLVFSPVAQLTTGQLFHISLCNLATSIYTEVASVSGLAAVAGPPTSTGDAYAQAVLKLKLALSSLQDFIVGITRAFLTNGCNTLWSAVKLFLGDGDRQAVETKVRAVMGRQLLFFVRGTPHYEASRQEAAEQLVLRSLYLCCATRAGDVELGRLKVLPEVIAPLGALERFSASTRRYFKTLAFYENSAVSLHGREGTLHPLMQIALIFSQQPEGAGVLLHTAMKESIDKLTASAAAVSMMGDGSPIDTSFVKQIAEAVRTASVSFPQATKDRLAALVTSLE